MNLTLNLPMAQPLTRPISNGSEEIFDPLRSKFVALTPEEWVRFQFTSFLISHMGYPKTLMANEVAIRVNSTSKRCDTVVYSRQGLKPLLIAEYKAPSVKISQRTFNQIMRYCSAMRVKWIIVSNGLQHFCCHLDSSTGSYTFHNAIPRYTDL